MAANPPVTFSPHAMIAKVNIDRLRPLTGALSYVLREAVDDAPRLRAERGLINIDGGRGD